MASTDTCAIRATMHYISKIRLIWLSRTHPLYRSLFRQVLREVCRYLADSLQRLICLAPQRLATFSLTTLEYSQSLPLPSTVRITGCAAYLQIDDWNVVLYPGVSGLYRETTVHLITVEDALVRVCQLGSLRHKRCSPAMISVSGKVYVFGSGRDSFQITEIDRTTGESLLLLRPTAWELLPGRMAMPVADTSPCESRQRIYLFASACKAQIFDITAQEYRTGPDFALPAYLGPAICWKSDDHCILFLRECEAVLDLRRSTAKWRNKKPEQFDIVSMPIVRGESVFWCGGENSCYRLERKKGRCVLQKFFN